MLRPSRPMIRPFISSLGRWMTLTVCSAVWSAATRWMAVTMTSRALSWASSRAARSIVRAIRTASCSASSRTASSRMPLASSADRPLTASRATTCSWRARATSSRAFSRSRSRSMSLRSRCSSMSARWSSCSSRWSRRRSRALSSPRLAARLVLGLALQPELLVLGLEDEVLLLAVRLLDDERGLLLGLLHPLARPHAAQHESGCSAGPRGQDGHDDGDGRIHHRSGPPVRRDPPEASMSRMRRHDGGWLGDILAG